MNADQIYAKVSQAVADYLYFYDPNEVIDLDTVGDMVGEVIDLVIEKGREIERLVAEVPSH